MTTLPELNWEALEEEVVTLLQQLVRLETVNPPGNEGPAVEMIRELLVREGLEPVVVEGAAGRPNLVVRLPGSGRRPSLLLDSHLDVVPADPAGWTVPPFSGQLRDGCIWGRGTLDMKQMTALSLVVLLTVVRHRLPLGGDLVLSATADEEAGSGLGAFFLARHHPDLVRADFALGEVGGMNQTVNGTRIYPVQVAERGLCWLRLTVRGQGGHGSMPRSDAVPARIEAVLARLRKLDFPLQPHAAALAFLDTLARHSSPVDGALLRAVARGPGGRLLLARFLHSARGPALRAMLSHTCQPTVVRCGEKINVIPTSGTIDVDCRILPGTAPEEMRQWVSEAVAGLAEVELLSGHRGHATTSDNPLYRQIVNTMARMDPEGVVTPYLMPGFTNGSAYAQLGTTYLGFTPVMLPPTMVWQELFHAPNERIPVAGLKWGLRTLWDVVYNFVK